MIFTMMSFIKFIYFIINNKTVVNGLIKRIKKRQEEPKDRKDKKGLL